VEEWFPHLCLLPTKHTHSGRYSDQYILEFYKQKLKSMPCQNQGFVLDGFPKTYEQAKQLFAPEEEEEDEGQDSDQSAPYNKLFMPGKSWTD